jgi:hypothetical protein
LVLQFREKLKFAPHSLLLDQRRGMFLKESDLMIRRNVVVLKKGFTGMY